jgi:hypothetical protein
MVALLFSTDDQPYSVRPILARNFVHYLANKPLGGPPSSIPLGELAVPDVTDQPYIAVLDFGVSNTGRLAAIPDVMKLAESKASDSQAPMALLNVDADGLWVTGGLLKFAWTNDSPRLFDSARAVSPSIFAEQMTSSLPHTIGP